MGETLFADIALGLPPPGIFQYAVPDHLRDSVQIGKRVFIRVRERRLVGYVVGLAAEKIDKELKPIDSVIDPAPILTSASMDLTRWMADYYFCSWGQAIEASLPAPFKKGRFLMKSRSKETPVSRAEMVNPSDLSLTPAQEGVYQKIVAPIHGRKSAFFLLHGVTGSGKTEVYMHLIRECLKESRGSIVLVPEISLTPQTVDRFYSRFGDRLAVVHSRLAPARRVEEWHRIRSGQAQVVVGARSAVFSPVKDLALIVIDEEHDTSYKQEETPRYHTHEVARRRAMGEDAVLLLGSATPSLESVYDTETGRATRLLLSERIENRPMPQVEILDMRRQRDGKTRLIFSDNLEKNVRESLAKKEQVILFLNRRGFSTYLHCASCGYVATCENCRVALAYHFDKGILLCHVCHFKGAPAALCPSCQKNYLHYFGIGTQKVEVEAMRLFPGAKIARMDADSTSKKDAHERVIRAFKNKEVDILIGTQMIAKGHDFPNVSFIGVISADTALYIPDFRAAERTFNLLTQVAGRTGRGDVPGKVIIQSHVPHHYAIQSAKDHDYGKFYEKEMIFRKELAMPPYSRLIKVVFSGLAEKEVVRQILLFAKHLAASFDKERFKILGPAPCLVSKQGGRFLWNFYFKGPAIQEMNPILRGALSEFKRSRVTVSIDVDPQ